MEMYVPCGTQGPQWASVAFAPNLVITSFAPCGASRASCGAPTWRTMAAVSDGATRERRRDQQHERRAPGLRFLTGVPAALPHEVLRPQRGRGSRRHVRAAEHFRRYMFLRRLLKPWSEMFQRKHGRVPTLVDVHRAQIPGLLDRFEEYLAALDGMRTDT